MTDSHRKCIVCSAAWVPRGTSTCPPCREVVARIAAVDRGAGGLTPPWVVARIELYAARAAAGLPIFAEAGK